MTNVSQSGEIEAPGSAIVHFGGCSSTALGCEDQNHCNDQNFCDDRNYCDDQYRLIDLKYVGIGLIKLPFAFRKPSKEGKSHK